MRISMPECSQCQQHCILLLAVIKQGGKSGGWAYRWQGIGCGKLPHSALYHHDTCGALFVPPLLLPGMWPLVASQVLKGRLALIAPSVSCGEFIYEEGEGLEEDEVNGGAGCGCTQGIRSLAAAWAARDLLASQLWLASK